MSVVATLCDLRTLIVPSAPSVRTTGTRALSRILRQSPAFCHPGKTSGLSGIVRRELWGARQARLCNRLTCRKQRLELIKFAFTLRFSRVYVAELYRWGSKLSSIRFPRLRPSEAQARELQANCVEFARLPGCEREAAIPELQIYCRRVGLWLYRIQQWLVAQVFPVRLCSSRAIAAGKSMVFSL